MTMAIMQMRLQLLNRQIHRKNCRLQELTQQEDALSMAYTNASSLYKQIYLQLNGIGGTVSEEMRQTLTNQLGQLEPIVLMSETKSDDLELEISEISSELKQYTAEQKEVQNWINEKSKKETAHYTTS